MASQESNADSNPQPPATGKIRRWPARRIAVCAAIALAALACGTGGWLLHGALRPAPQTAAPDDHLAADAAHHEEPDAEAHDERSEGEAHADDPHDPPGDATTAKRHADLSGDDYADLLEGRLPSTLRGEPLDSVDHSEAGSGEEEYRTPNALVPSAGELDRAAAMGETFMSEGDAQRALGIFDWLLEHQDRSRDDRFHYRCGLCAEATGKLNRALQEYGTALAAAHDPNIIALCRLGQARVWRSLGHGEMAIQILASAWLTNGREGHAAVVRSFNAYLLADAIASETLSVQPSELSEDESYFFPVWEFDLFERTLLSTIRQEASGDTPIKGGVRLLSESSNGESHLNVALQINLPRMGVVNAVEALCRSAGWRVVWSSDARLAASGRSAEICLAQASLPMCLDALTAPLGIVWTQRPDEIHISTAAEVDEQIVAEGRRHAAKRALEHAVRRHPDFLLAPEALVALGNLALREGRHDDAAALYEEVLESYPTDPVRSAAWFNLAKLHLGLEHTQVALDAFWRVIDSGGAPDIASVAYLYVGRLLIDAEQPRRAITPLIRATKWAPGSKVRAKSVLCLAAAYLLYGNPRGANNVLMDFRTDVKSQAGEAAFLSALARYRVANSPSRRFTEGQALLAAVDPVNPEGFFGRYGWYLCGSAYEELLLPEIAVDVYQQAFDLLERPPYHDAVAFALAKCLADSGDADAARHRLTYMLEHSAPDWQRRAAFRLCRLQLDSDLPQAAAHTAHDLVGRCAKRDHKVRALRLLGESYQRLGDHSAAAMCFAGSVPDHPPPTETVHQ